MRNCLIFVLALALSGCANMNQQSRAGANDDPTVGCMDYYFSVPEIQVLNVRVGDVNRASQVSFAQLANRERPNEAEKHALSLWADARKRCVESGDEFRRQYAPPGFNTVYTNTQTRLLGAIARLYSGEITFGQFNAERTQISNDMAANMELAKANHMNALNIQEQLTNDAAVQIMLQNAARRPRQTDCYRVGPGSVSCTTK